MNSLAGVVQVLESGLNAVHIDPAMGARACVPIDRMLAFTAAQKAGHDAGALIPHFGAA